MLLQIGEFSKKSGTSIRTLRYYDKIDLFTGYRYYSNKQINDLELINKLKSIGFCLASIKNI
ncbi:MAG: MerR family transcriptional regulator [Bacilli bacterium]|nr:MerR family transcriptional regulator [Bacilli bacterium]